ncbi:metal ABC transporter ATP-binding protein [Nesterenkonia aerolata]|uniref:Metal ABC transporter ATP-binding protein n=1 Tax=Nesterenkonia aerolata TaxID=3074079 RepID=A0ABU2DUK9_9MICC|nr:metal ABC transporter ATP-binding protein [Nesterenkonia sp. LY-0111]MDR8020180.1 metal ABC transporter ATP-binding protein [Nesterenkonia sp. LY-0111]
MSEPVLSLSTAGIGFHGRTLWRELDLDVAPGEFLAVLGPNGAGKSTLLKVLLGLQRLDTGTATIEGRPARRGSPRVGYIPQQATMAAETPLRARDMVALGLDGHRYGIRWHRRTMRRRVDALLEKVGATDYADVPVGLLSGGEQQRLRAAQALASEPAVLLCDEPLHSLDLHHQQAITALIQEQTQAGTAVVFVTHEINPVIDSVDRVLYMTPEGHRIGTTAEVMRSEVLSALYGAPIDVLEHRGRLVVMSQHFEGHHCAPGHPEPSVQAPEDPRVGVGPHVHDDDHRTHRENHRDGEVR